MGDSRHKNCRQVIGVQPTTQFTGDSNITNHILKQYKTNFTNHISPGGIHRDVEEINLMFCSVGMEAVAIFVTCYLSKQDWETI